MKASRIIIFIFTLSVFQIGFSQEQNIEDKKNPSKKVNTVWLPIIASTPATGWMFGVAPAANWNMGDPETTSISSALGSIIYTTKKQWLLTLKSTAFLKEDSWAIMTDWRYFITSQPTFGLGTGPQSARLVSTGIEYDDGLVSAGIDEAQFMKFNFLRLYQTALKRINNSRFFVGVGYHLDIHSKIDDQLLDLETTPEVITSHYAYSMDKGFNPEKYTLSGVSINALYDTRDNTINPYDGRYAFISFKVNPQWLGSNKSSSTLWLEYRDYFNLNKNQPRNVLALWTYSNFETSGTLPYLDLPSLGWDQFGRSGRAYPQGRFRGQSLSYTELEWRFPLQKNKEKWGAVIYANATTATNKDANIKMFDYINTGIGTGLRFMVNEKSRTNIALDYAFGNYGAQGFYLSVNEVF